MTRASLWCLSIVMMILRAPFLGFLCWRVTSGICLHGWWILADKINTGFPDCCGNMNIVLRRPQRTSLKEIYYSIFIRNPTPFHKHSFGVDVFILLSLVFAEKLQPFLTEHYSEPWVWAGGNGGQESGGGGGQEELFLITNWRRLLRGCSQIMSAPLPPLSANVSISLTPPPPFVSQCQHLLNPPPLWPCQFCQHIKYHPFLE